MEIKAIEKVPHCDDCSTCGEGYTYLAFDKKIVRQLEADFKEAIEALKNDAISTDNFLSDHSNIPFRQDHIEAHKNRIKIVEKAYGEKWEDIRRKK